MMTPADRARALISDAFYPGPRESELDGLAVLAEIDAALAKEDT